MAHCIDHFSQRLILKPFGPRRSKTPLLKMNCSTKIIWRLIDSICYKYAFKCVFKNYEPTCRCNVHTLKISPQVLDSLFISISFLFHFSALAAMLCSGCVGHILILDLALLDNKGIENSCTSSLPI